jgi:hypothetical protein
MMWTQIKAFSLLLAVLLTVDAIKFHGEYRTMVTDKIGSIAHKITPRHWSGLGGGRDWSAPR